MNPKAIGEITEAVITAQLLKAGKVVLKPYGDNQRYDMVIDNDGAFLRVQCKTGNFKNGRITFKTASSQAHRGKGRKSYRGQVEFFAVYCPELDKTYLVPVDDVGESEAVLRVEPSQNGQQSGVRWACNYEL